MDKQTYAVKCERVVTFYINVKADNEWNAQHVAEYEQRQDKRLGYDSVDGPVRALSAVELPTS